MCCSGGLTADWSERLDLQLWRRFSPNRCAWFFFSGSGWTNTSRLGAFFVIFRFFGCSTENRWDSSLFFPFSNRTRELLGWIYPTRMLDSVQTWRPTGLLANEIRDIFQAEFLVNPCFVVWLVRILVHPVEIIWNLLDAPRCLISTRY